MALPVNGSTHLIPALLLIYRPRKDERLSWPSWLTCSGRFTHTDGHPSAAGREQVRESSPVRDRHSVPRHQLLSLEIGEKFQREVPLFLQISEFLYNTTRDWWKKPLCQKPDHSVHPLRELTRHMGEHTVLPAIRQRWHSCPYPSWRWNSIKRHHRDARLSR